MRARRTLVSFTLAVGCLIVGVAQASSASAHAQIVTSTPADGTNLGAAPDTITLVMSEAVELRYTKITVTDGQGRATALTGLRIGEPPAGSLPAEGGAGSTESSGSAGAGAEEIPVAITADLPALAPDLYHVAWSTVSSDDLHATNGVLVFGVQTAVPPRAAQAPDPLPSPGEVALRWLGLVGVGAATGAALLWLLMARGRRADEGAMEALAHSMLGHRLLSLAALGAAVGGLADAARLLVQAHVAGGGWFGPAAHLLSGSYGLRWAGREAAAVAIVALALRARPGRTERSAQDRTRVRRRMLLGIVAVSGLYALAVTLTGHAGAGAARHPLRVVLETAHVTAAMTWMGALVAGSLVLWRPMAGPPQRSYLGPAATSRLRRLVLSRFGVVAAACLAVMVTTGLLLAGSGLASADAVLMSTYGRLVLV
jgi:copper transport protein